MQYLVQIDILVYHTVDRVSWPSL